MRIRESVLRVIWGGAYSAPICAFLVISLLLPSISAVARCENPARVPGPSLALEDSTFVLHSHQRTAGDSGTWEEIRASYGGGRDTFICSFYEPLIGDNRNWNMGADDEIFISLDSGGAWKVFRGLVYFDLSDFDYNDSIVLTGASLNLYCFKDEGDSSANPLDSIE